MENTKPEEPSSPLPPVPLTPPTLLLVGFWALLGTAGGITVTQSIWRLIGWSIGEVSIAVPVGGVVGAAIGVLLGLIREPHWQVFLVAVFAGAASGAVAGRVPWGETGELIGQVLGGLLGAVAWSTWLFFRWKRQPDAFQPSRKDADQLPDH